MKIQDFIYDLDNITLAISVLGSDEIVKVVFRPPAKALYMFGYLYQSRPGDIFIYSGTAGEFDYQETLKELKNKI